MAVQRRRWRDYRSETGARPVKKFLDSLPDQELASVVAAMKEVAVNGLVAARHIRGDIYEVRATSEQSSYRILFAVEGRRSQILLSLNPFPKKSQRTPARHLDLAEKRLREWRRRGQSPL